VDTKDFVAIALATVACLAGMGALIYPIMHGRAELNQDGAERLERVSAEMVSALRGLTDELRRTREEQFAMHKDNAENNREIREVLRLIERSVRSS
jgi:hypothetical protein